jgi:hypothetical protein
LTIRWLDAIRPALTKEDDMPDTAEQGKEVTDFSLGDLYITPGAEEELSGADIFFALLRHWEEDWGDLDPADRKANDHALKHGGRLLSRYFSSRGKAFWVITEHDRSMTTVLLPNEY